MILEGAHFFILTTPASRPICGPKSWISLFYHKIEVGDYQKMDQKTYYLDPLSPYTFVENEGFSKKLFSFFSTL